MAYAAGKKAIGICDRCGFTYKLKDLKYEVQDQKKTGSRICPSCIDPDQPQYRIGEVDTSDNIGLYNPRPDSGEAASTSYFGFNPLNSTGMVIRGGIGFSTITTTNVPSPSPSPSPANVSVQLTQNQLSTYINAVSALAITNYVVTVQAYGGGNRFYIDSVRQPTLTLEEGKTYRFDQGNASNGTHPLRFSTTSDGTHGGGSEYTTGVTTYGTPGNAGAYTQITVAVGAPTLYYYCTNHSGMGGQANTP